MSSSCRLSPRRSPIVRRALAPPLRLVTLRFARVPATRSPEDFHLLTECRAGRIKKPPGQTRPGGWLQLYAELSKKLARDRSSRAGVIRLRAGNRAGLYLLRVDNRGLLVGLFHESLSLR